MKSNIVGRMSLIVMAALFAEALGADAPSRAIARPEVDVTAPVKDTGKGRSALVIGNFGYSSRPLRNAGNDAWAMKDTTTENASASQVMGKAWISCGFLWPVLLFIQQEI